MKKLLIYGGLIIGIIFFSNTNALAQSDFKVGGGLAYGSEVEAIGIQVGGVYSFSEEIDGAADFTLFFPDGYDWWTINANVHYGFVAEDDMDVYGLAGLNYATMEFDNQFGSASASEAGLNIGGGAEFNVDFASIFGELKYILGDADQLVLNAGLRFAL